MTHRSSWVIRIRCFIRERVSTVLTVRLVVLRRLRPAGRLFLCQFLYARFVIQGHFYRWIFRLRKVILNRWSFFDWFLISDDKIGVWDKRGRELDNFLTVLLLNRIVIRKIWRHLCFICNVTATYGPNVEKFVIVVNCRHCRVRFARVKSPAEIGQNNCDWNWHQNHNRDNYHSS